MPTRSTAWSNTCMRFPETLAIAAAAMAACAALAAAPDQSRGDIAAALKARLPDLAEADYALGSAAFDAEIRRVREENATAGAAAIEAGKALWTRKFRDGRTLGGCFPNGGRRGAASYPPFGPRGKRASTLAKAGDQWLQAHKETPFDHPGPPHIGGGIWRLR